MKFTHVVTLSLLLLASCVLGQAPDATPANLPALKPGEAVAAVATENYHQNYCKGHPDQPYIQQVSQPEIDKMRKAMHGKLKIDS